MKLPRGDSNKCGRLGMKLPRGDSNKAWNEATKRGTQTRLGMKLPRGGLKRGLE